MKTKGNSEGVDYVFEQNPELERIGTKEQYEKYLETIFPDSKVKDVAYHHSDKKIKKFKKNFKKGYASKKGVSSKAIFFIGKPASKKSFLSKRNFLGVYLVNLSKPLVIKENKSKIQPKIKENVNKALTKSYDGVIFKKVWDNQMFCKVYVVFKRSQIHILNSKKDLRNFKKFLRYKK